MNTKIKVTRFVIALLLTLSPFGVSTSAVFTDQPKKNEYVVDPDSTSPI